MYARERFAEQLEAGNVVFGTSAHSSAPELIELYALVGFDYVFFDMMFSTIDWERAGYLISAARAAGMTAVPRVQTYPWSAKGAGIDRAMLANISRALGVGAGVVMYSASTVDEIRAATELANHFYHRKTHLFGPRTVDTPDYHTTLGGKPLVVPGIEADEPFERLEEVFQIEGLPIVHLALGDLSKMITGHVEHDHPDVWKAVDHAVALGQKYGKTVWCNTGYQAGGVPALIDRTKRLAEHGVQIILLSGATHILQETLYPLVNEVRDVVAPLRFDTAHPAVANTKE